MQDKIPNSEATDNTRPSSKEIPRIIDYADEKQPGWKTDTKVDTKHQEKIQEDLLHSERLRRKLFENVVWLGVMVVVCLYILLGGWIFCSSGNHKDSNSLWHIATILALPPTTILFLLIKTLSKDHQSPSYNTSNTPTAEFLNQLLEVLKTWVGKK